jgi:hypothetical protein
VWVEERKMECGQVEVLNSGGRRKVKIRRSSESGVRSASKAVTDSSKYS